MRRVLDLDIAPQLPFVGQVCRRDHSRSGARIRVIGQTIARRTLSIVEAQDTLVDLAVDQDMRAILEIPFQRLDGDCRVPCLVPSPGALRPP